MKTGDAVVLKNRMTIDRTWIWSTPEGTQREYAAVVYVDCNGVIHKEVLPVDVLQSAEDDLLLYGNTASDSLPSHTSDDDTGSSVMASDVHGDQ